MDFKVEMTTADSAALTESIHATLEDAVKALSDTVDAHPEILKGLDDLGVITDVSDETVVIALFRMGAEFILARETTDERYADSLFALKYERYDSDGDPYMVFGRWSA